MPYRLAFPPLIYLQCVISHEFREWIQTVAFGDVDEDQHDELVVGLVDSSVHLFKLPNRQT